MEHLRDLKQETSLFVSIFVFMSSRNSVELSTKSFITSEPDLLVCRMWFFVALFPYRKDALTLYLLMLSVFQTDWTQNRLEKTSGLIWIKSVWHSELEFIPPGPVAQLVTCLATDACLTADPGVASSIPARYHTFVEIDHEIISTVILLPSADLFKKGCCQLQAKVCAQITG